MKKFIAFLLFIFFIAFSPSAKAAGGTCPTGANYINPANPTGALVTLSSIGITSCYFISAGGADTNNGIAEATPWLHAPGMPSCSSNCSSASITAGEGFIFRGGDTWHFGNSGLSPYTGGQWNWTHAGSSTSSPIYLGIDLAWFSGASWSRPVLNGDNPLLASTGSPPNSPVVASCTYTFTNANMIVFEGLNNWWFDDFEILGYCGTSGTSPATFGNGYMFKMNGSSFPNNDYFIRNYIHGWTRATPTNCNNNNASLGCQAIMVQVGSSFNNGPGWHFWFNVSDGQDSDVYATGLWGGASDGWDLAYNVVRYQDANNVPDNLHIAHDNLFEYIQNTTDDSTHTDILFGFSEYSGCATTPNIFYNNIYRHLGTLNNQSMSYVQQNDTPSGCTDYVFNTLIYDSQPTGSQTLDQHDNACSSCPGSVVYFNNTGSIALVAGGDGGQIFGRPGSNTTTAVNNHFVSSSGTQASIWQSTSNLTETNTLYMTESTATADGYTAANLYAPTTSSSPTVTFAGTNETTGFCADSVLHNAAAEAACIAGGTNACTYNISNHTVSCPAQTANARPASGNWQAGEYQFLAGSVSLSPSSNNFGSINVGSSSSPVTFTLINNSSTTATSIAPTTTGGNSGDFTITNSGAGSCSAAGNSIAASASCTFTVTFSPSAGGSRSTTLSVSYGGGDSASPQTSTLSGTGVSGSVTLSPSSKNFGSVNVGSSSSPTTFTVTNNNSTTATSINPTTTGGNSGDFTIINSGAGSCSAAGGSLAFNASCTFTVTFSPTASGTRSTTLSVAYSGGDGASPQTAALSGTGTSAAALGTMISGSATISGNLTKVQ